MGPIKWIKSKFAEFDRRLEERYIRGEPARQERAAKLKAQIAEMEEKLKQSKARR